MFVKNRFRWVDGVSPQSITLRNKRVNLSYNEDNGKRVLSIETNRYQLKSQKSRIGESITDGAILKAEG